MIYEHAANGTVRLAYDFPSSLMSRLDTEASLRPQGSSAPSPTVRPAPQPIAVAPVDEWLALRLALCAFVHKPCDFLVKLEAPPGFEPGVEVLQASQFFVVGNAAFKRATV